MYYRRRRKKKQDHRAPNRKSYRASSMLNGGCYGKIPWKHIPFRHRVQTLRWMTSNGMLFCLGFSSSHLIERWFYTNTEYSFSVFPYHSSIVFYCAHSTTFWAWFSYNLFGWTRNIWIKTCQVGDYSRLNSELTMLSGSNRYVFLQPIWKWGISTFHDA